MISLANAGLQDVTHELNLFPGRYKTVRMDAPVIRDNPLLELNRNRCILCGRCVKACKEIEGVGAIDFQNRGIKTVIGTAFDRPLECSFAVVVPQCVQQAHGRTERWGSKEDHGNSIKLQRFALTVLSDVLLC